jgi:hypothetical protein
MKKYLLTAYIGGAHFSVCLFDVGSRKPLTETFCREAVPYKAGSEAVTNVWKSTVGSLNVNKESLLGCAISVPLALINHTSLTDNICYGRYAALRDINLQAFFARVTELDMDDVRLYHTGSAFLKGQLLGCTLPGNQCLTAIHVGTDFSAASFDPYNISSLNWETWPFLNSCLNDYLSTQWLIRRYFQFTDISAFNVKQLAALYRKHPTVRRIFKEYFENMIRFLKRAGLNKNLHTVFVGGDLVDCFPRLPQQLSAALEPVVIIPVKYAAENILLGTSALFFQGDLV